MTVLQKTVVLDPHELSNVKSNINKKITKDLENTLIGDGFVTKVNHIVSMSRGIVQQSPSCAVEYAISVDVDVFNVNINDVIDITLDNVSGMGVFGKYQHATVIVPHHGIAQHNLDDTDNIIHSEGDVIRVKVTGKRITHVMLCTGTEIFEDAF